MFTLCAGISIQQKGGSFLQEKTPIKEWGQPTGSILWSDNQQEFCVKKKTLIGMILVRSVKTCLGSNWTVITSYSSRTRRIWADIYNQRGHRPSWLLSAHIRQVRENNCFSKFSSNSLDFFGWNLRKSWHFLYRRRRETFFSDQHKKFAISFSLFGQT